MNLIFLIDARKKIKNEKIKFFSRKLKIRKNKRKLKIKNWTKILNFVFRQKASVVKKSDLVVVVFLSSTLKLVSTKELQ